MSRSGASREESLEEEARLEDGGGGGEGVALPGRAKALRSEARYDSRARDGLAKDGRGVSCGATRLEARLERVEWLEETRVDCVVVVVVAVEGVVCEVHRESEDEDRESSPTSWNPSSSSSNTLHWRDMAGRGSLAAGRKTG